MRLFLYFVILSIYANRKRILSIAIPSIILLSLLLSTLFLANSIEYQYLSLVKSTANKNIIYQRYYTSPKDTSFLIVGVDDKILKDNEMIVGEGVKRWLKAHYYDSSYNFISSVDGNFIELKIKRVLDKSFTASDVVIVSKKIAKAILGDIKPTKIDYESTILNKEGGLFRVLTLIVAIGTIMLLYLRYNQSITIEQREVKTLLAVGWTKEGVVKFKLLEWLIVALFSFLLAYNISYIVIFWLKAPIIGSIFFGISNIAIEPHLLPYIDFVEVFYIFAIYLLLFSLLILLSFRKSQTFTR